MKEKMQEAAFMIIACVGTAKSMYMEALGLAKKGEFKKVEKVIKKADETFAEAHQLHLEFVQKEAQGEQLPFSLILMHAEDQMLTTETLKILIIELIEIYEKKCKL
jgi:PTS system cellobiose-specific IIA component